MKNNLGCEDGGFSAGPVSPEKGEAGGEGLTPVTEINSVVVEVLGS